MVKWYDKAKLKNSYRYVKQQLHQQLTMLNIGVRRGKLRWCELRASTRAMTSCTRASWGELRQTASCLTPT